MKHLLISSQNAVFIHMIHLNVYGSCWSYVSR